MDITAFRTDFPEFADTTKYPDAMVTFWSGIVEKRMRPVQTRWADMYTEGMELATAHYVALAARNAKKPGVGGGLTSSKSAGDVAVSYDTSAITMPGAGHWNETSYGRQYMELANIAGMAGVQL